MRLHRLFFLLLGSLILSGPIFGQSPVSDAPVESDPDATPSQTPENYIRLLRDEDDQPTALQTATVRFQSDDGTIVDLIGVVHIGDKSYYESFNESFQQYDVVLYELVAPQGTRIPKGGRDASNNPMAFLHGMAQSILGLSSQLDHVDYTPENLVHADMSPSDMAAALENRGTTPWSFALRAIADMVDEASNRVEAAAAEPDDANNDVDFFSMLTDPNAGEKLKVQMAEQFGAMSSPDAALGAAVNELLIQDRNQAALKIFKQELAAGRRKIGIFYGAAHMPDFEERLTTDFGFHRTNTTWASAWDLSTPSTRTTTSPFGAMLRVMQQATDELSD